MLGLERGLTSKLHNQSVCIHFVDGESRDISTDLIIIYPLSQYQLSFIETDIAYKVLESNIHFMRI